MEVLWEIPLEVLESNFKYDHRLEGDVRILATEVDDMAGAIMLTLDVELDDVERIPDSDGTGRLIL